MKLALEMSIKNKGFFNITKIGYFTNTSVKQELIIEGEKIILSDLDNSESHAWSLQTVNGYFISPYLSLGIAIGLDSDNNFTTLPVMLDIRTYMSDKADSFYAFLDIGPTLKIGGKNSELRKGLAFNIGLGYKFKISEKLFLISDLSYSHKNVSLTNEGIGTSDNIIKANGIGLNIGIIF